MQRSISPADEYNEIHAASDLWIDEDFIIDSIKIQEIE